MAIDAQQIMKLMQNPQVQQLLKNLLSQGGKGGLNVQGLMDQLNQGGLNKQVDSWVSTDQNQPVTGEQIQEALGPQLDQAAKEAGLPPAEAADDLAQTLPQLINNATPEGQAPNVSDLQGMLSQLLGGKK